MTQCCFNTSHFQPGLYSLQIDVRPGVTTPTQIPTLYTPGVAGLARLEVALARLPKVLQSVLERINKQVDGYAASSQSHRTKPGLIVLLCNFTARSFFVLHYTQPRRNVHLAVKAFTDSASGWKGPCSELGETVTTELSNSKFKRSMTMFLSS